MLSNYAGVPFVTFFTEAPQHQLRYNSSCNRKLLNFWRFLANERLPS
jgi:hypothetical protein